MATTILMQKRLGSFRPFDDEGAEVLRGVAEDEIVKITFSRPRNIQHHRLFYALMNLVYQNQDQYEQFDHMMVALKVALGHCDTVICKDGNPAYLPKSISFAKMDQGEFDQFFNKVVDIVCKHFLPGTNNEDLRREVFEMIGIAA